MAQLSNLYTVNLSGNQVSQLDSLLTFAWIVDPFGRANYNLIFDLTNNPIDCVEQADNIQALRSAKIALKVDCP